MIDSCTTTPEQAYQFYAALDIHVKKHMLGTYPNNCPAELIQMAIALEQLAKEMRLTASHRIYCYQAEQLSKRQLLNTPE